MTVAYADRANAGRHLAARLGDRAGRDDLIVLALPRGGVPVAFEVARHLRAPLDIFLVLKLGVPWFPELAMGALASGGVQVLNDDVVGQLGISKSSLDDVLADARRELARREAVLRHGRPAAQLRDRELIVIDDGLATGSTMQAAVEALRRLGPSRIVVAVPVGEPAACRRLDKVADEVICLLRPQPFHSIGLWYEDFTQTDDETVQRLLAGSALRNAPDATTAPGGGAAPAG